jgi:D-alanyl-D-alanine carboxypeptidase
MSEQIGEQNPNQNVDANERIPQGEEVALSQDIIQQEVQELTWDQTSAESQEPLSEEVPEESQGIGTSLEEVTAESQGAAMEDTPTQPQATGQKHGPKKKRVKKPKQAAGQKKAIKKKKASGQRRAPQHSKQTPPPTRRGKLGPLIVLACVAVALVVGIVCSLTQCNKQTATSQSSEENNVSGQAGNGTSQDGSSTTSTTNKDSWELTLVNSTHPLPEDWKVELVTVADGRQVDARIADQFNQMIADCRAAGYDDVFVNQAYRSHEDQQAIWDEFYNEYLAEGYSEKEAKELTGQSVAVPGTSEHELGLAADICSINFDETYNAPIQTWLRENGHKYGFIQRYPESKESVTGIKNENWHFRYVGVEAATAMHESGQVLEEYLGETSK